MNLIDVTTSYQDDLQHVKELFAQVKSGERGKLDIEQELRAFADKYFIGDASQRYSVLYERLEKLSGYADV